MKHRFSCPALILVFCTFAVLVLAHEKTGWIAPESAKRVKNPIKPTKASIQKGKEIYEKKCALCHGDKGDGKRTRSRGIKSKADEFPRFSWAENNRWRALLENYDRKRPHALL